VPHCGFLVKEGLNLKVTYKLFANFRDLAPEDTANGRWDMELPDNYDIKMALKKIGVETDGGTAALIMINGRVVQEDTPVKDGDEISVFPPLVGG